MLKSFVIWLKAFDPDELEQFFTEVQEAFHKAHVGKDSWDEFEAVLYEWH